MFADKIMETITPAGTGAYQLAGPPAGSAYGTWRSKFATATVVGYFASNAAGTKWEMGYGTLTYGSPDTLTRNLFAGTNSSSTGSLISWASGDSPVNVYSVPIGVMMAHLVSGGLLSARPAWAQAGLGWLDYTIGLATTWVKKRWTGTVDMEEGRFDIAAGIFTPSPRNKWVDNGAAGLTMATTHIGQVILFDCSAAARTFTALAGATTGIGHGFTVWVLGYGSTTNGVTLAPNGSEKIDQGAASASLTIPPNILTRLSWDGAKLQWRTDYTPYYFGVRNRLINGSMRNDQRNAGAAQIFTAAAPVAYCIDRWYGSCTGANVNGQRVAGSGAYQYLYQFTGAASVTQVLLGQRIEATNICDLVSTTATLSAMISSSTLTSITWTAYYPTVADTFSAKTQIATGTFTINSTLTRYSVQIALGANVDKGLAIEFTTGAFASGTLKIGGVQMEPGSAVTDFEVIAVDDEMFRCQRYYETGIGTIAIAYIPSPGWNMANSFGFKVTKRTTPTITTTFGTLHTTNVNGVVLYATMNAAPEQDNLTFTAAAEI